MAFPRKFRYDKGKNKVNPDASEDPSLVDPVIPLRIEGKRDVSSIFDLLATTRPSREVSVPVKRDNPLMIPSRDMTLIAEGSNSPIFTPLEVLHPPLPSSTTDPLELLTTRAIQEDFHPEAEIMEPSASSEMDKSGAFTPRTDFMEDDEVTGRLRGLSADNRFFQTNPSSGGPSNDRTSDELVKFLGRKINWVGDPFKAFADLIPLSPATEAIAPSRPETVNEALRYLVDAEKEARGISYEDQMVREQSGGFPNYVRMFPERTWDCL
ncbi:hypothetical protein FH972_012586 [Carpinus fangiana]|uniref:Uncharacterized protein n=1 Tax=Carpinus fangiana TaxID=176857 RepID=A0A5N6R7D4_9ROSI|nr:hypothetical protein FH972_012586 [Carpinus fangiana]